MKSVLQTNVPKDVIFCVREMVKDFSTYLLLAKPSKETREEIKTRIDNLNRVLKAPEWHTNHFGVLVECFYESKISYAQMTSPQAKQIIKESELVLNFCEQHNNITYFPNGTFVMSPKLGKLG